jgi:hypothetical protein
MKLITIAAGLCFLISLYIFAIQNDVLNAIYFMICGVAVISIEILYEFIKFNNADNIYFEPENFFNDKDEK